MATKGCTHGPTGKLGTFCPVPARHITSSGSTWPGVKRPNQPRMYQPCCGIYHGVAPPPPPNFLRLRTRASRPSALHGNFDIILGHFSCPRRPNNGPDNGVQACQCVTAASPLRHHYGSTVLIRCDSCTCDARLENERTVANAGRGTGSMQLQVHTHPSSIDTINLYSSD